MSNYVTEEVAQRPVTAAEQHAEVKRVMNEVYDNVVESCHNISYEGGRLGL